MDKLILGTVYLAKGILYGFVVYMIIFLVLKLVNGRKMGGKYVQCFVEYSFVVYIITLMQVTGITDIFSWSFIAGKAFNWIPFVNEDMRLLFLNVLLFIPMGIFLPILVHRNWSFWKIVLVGMSLSLLIEMIQLFLVGRTADIDDVLANTVGSIAGYMIFCPAEKIFRKKQDKPIGVGTLTGGLALAILLFCIPFNRICLGDALLAQLSLPSWSGNSGSIYSMQGLHYTLVIGVILTTFVMLAAKRHKNDFGAMEGLRVSIIIEGIIVMIMCIETVSY